MAALFFKVFPFQTIWGGEGVKDYFGYDYIPEKTGQAWAFAAQEGKSNECITEPYKGKTLRDLWINEPELFGKTEDIPFPVIVSLLSPISRLSIQNHPDVEHAQADGYPYGKNECWYLLEAKEGEAIVFGHKAKDEEDLRKNYIEPARWSELLEYLPVHKDDFVYIPAGVLHACCPNVVIYEVQQSTDVTYRFYDFDRVDDQGNKRELHLEKAIATLSYEPAVNTANPQSETIGTTVRTLLISNDSFTVTKLEIKDEYQLDDDCYQLVSVVRGEGTLDGKPIKVGDNFLKPAGESFCIKGECTLMMTTA